MSNTPDPFQPPREVVSPPNTRQRPTGVTVFAILNVLFGIMGILGIGFSAIWLIVSPNLAAAGPNPVFDKVQESPLYAAFFIATLVLGGVFTFVLLASGIGLFKMSNGARRLAIAYAVYAIVSGIVGTAVNYFVVFAPMLRQANAAAGPQQIAVVAGAIGGMVGALIGLIFPVAILIYFLRSSVREMFLNWNAD